MAKKFDTLTDGISLDLEPNNDKKKNKKTVKKSKEPIILKDDDSDKSLPKVRKSATISVEANEKLQDMLTTLFTKYKVDLRRINESRLIELAILEWEPSVDTLDVYNKLVENDRRLKS